MLFAKTTKAQTAWHQHICGYRLQLIRNSQKKTSCWRDNEHSLHCPATFPPNVMWPDVFTFIQNLRNLPKSLRRQGRLLVREAILPLIELHPCTSVLEGAAMGEPLPAAATACSALCRNANIRLFEEKHNLGRNTEEQPWIPVRAVGFFSG